MVAATATAKATATVTVTVTVTRSQRPIRLINDQAYIYNFRSN